MHLIKALVEYKHILIGGLFFVLINISTVVLSIAIRSMKLIVSRK